MYDGASENDTVKDDIGCEKKFVQYVGGGGKSEVMRNCSERILRRVCKQPCTRSSTPCSAAMVKIETLKDHQIHKEQNTDSIAVQTTKNRRQWEQWSENDVECFFQGLAEHGKDFSNIQLHMKKKKRSKHEDDTKTREQIRDYYFRTWRKLSKPLNLVQETNNKKASRRELHYLLCLGELRKKGIMGLGQKVITQTHELVTKGFTNIRLKGKNLKVRAPNRHLKKLYHDENLFQDVLLPKHVNIEFLPNSNTAFNYVQMHAFNPRIRFVNVNITSKFSEVFDMFNKRFTDLCPEGEDLTLFPVFTSDIDSVQFAEVISNAEDTLESCERRQETPIILEDSRLLPTEKEQLDSSSEYTSEGFPKVFGQNEGKGRKKTFLGYWTQSIADEIHLRTLFIALGKIIPMKFRYEWKKTKETPSFGTDSLKFLRGYCIHEKSNFKETDDVNARIMFPKNNELENNVITDMYCPPVQRICVPVNNNKFSLPLRPRPGRQRGKRNILKSQMRIPNNRICNISNSSLRLNNAVAVNIIPQQLEQFTQQLTQHTMKDEPLSTCGKTSLPVVNVYPQPAGILPVQTNLTGGGSVHEEVIDEGDNNVHFKSLSSILASSALNQNISTKDIKGYLMLKTPTKRKGMCESTGPSSPNLEWLNNGESLDVTLSSFLNVNEMQALQEKLNVNEMQSLQEKVKTEKSDPPVTSLNGNVTGTFQMLLNDVTSIEGLKANAGNRVSDPKLPVFHSGDTSQEPFSVSFDLSNQGGDFKVKDEFV